MARPKLSVTMCNYNHAAYVQQALLAVINQTRPPDEIVVVDDGSRDDSVARIKEVIDGHKHIKLIVCPENVGTCNAAAIAASQVSGEFISAPTADDILNPRFFEQSLQMLEEHPQAALAVACVEDLYPDGKLIFNSFQLPTISAFPTPCYVSPERAIALERSYVPLGLLGYASVFRQSLYSPTFPHSQATNYLSDWFYLRVLAFRHGYCFLPEPGVQCRILPGSMSSTAMRSWPVRRGALQGVLQDLEHRFQDVLPAFKHSGALSTVGYRGVFWMLSQPRYWPLVSPLLLGKGLVNLQASLLPRSWITTIRRTQSLVVRQFRRQENAF